LRQSQSKGQLKGYSDEELDVLVCILLAARNYISYHFIYRDGTYDSLPSWVIPAYMKFVTGGVTFGQNNASRRQYSHAVNGRNGTSASPRMETVSADSSTAVINARISEAHLDSKGTVRRSILLDLLETAAASVAANGTKRAPKLLNLSVGFLTPTRAKVLVASAHCERPTKGVAHVSVRIAESRQDGSAVATAQLLFATETPSIQSD
jgi:acyl-coenzyme A thioesterase PaaI-like protein